MFGDGGGAKAVAARNHVTWERIVEMRPNDPEMLIGYALFLDEQDDNEKSEEIYKRCLQIEENNVKCLLHFANLMERQDRHKEACDLYWKAIHLDKQAAGVATNASRYGPSMSRQHMFVQEDEHDPEERRRRGHEPYTVQSQEEAEATLCVRCRKGGDDLKRCVRCKRVKYCCKECQTIHWKQHKKVCTRA